MTFVHQTLQCYPDILNSIQFRRVSRPFHDRILLLPDPISNNIPLKYRGIVVSEGKVLSQMEAVPSSHPSTLEVTPPFLCLRITLHHDES